MTTIKQQKFERLRKIMKNTSFKHGGAPLRSAGCVFRVLE